MRNTFILFVISVCFFSCVEEYHLSETRSTNNPSEIVIQGRILSGDKSVIYITRTQPLNSDEEPESVLNAQVTIIGQNGYESKQAEFDIEKDCYTIDTRELPNNTLYALKVEAEGETYQSEFQGILITPEIDEVNYKERSDGISIHVSTHNDYDASRFYMWSYEEDWEFHATLDIVGLGGGIPVFNKKTYPDLNPNGGHNPYLYCWKHAESSNIHIYSTAQLETNAANDVELFRIPIDDIRISYIYSILVKQWNLSEQAYNYYRTLEDMTEENNGLFTPMPSEIKGNITCISNPVQKVHGFVIASTITTKRIFVYEEQFEEIHAEYEHECIWKRPDPTDQSWYYKWTQDIEKNGAIALTKDRDLLGDNYLDNTLYSRECVDCRAIEGATKKRPDFWPNNHE